MADAQRIDPEYVELVASELKPARPGPGARVTRTAGQVGGATVLIDMWFAFGWLGADRWTPDQAAARWPAITAAVVFAVAVGQNLAGWWRER